MAKPNIVYILNDHQAFYGHAARRPVFEQFAAEGVRFERAYCVCPLCGPARRSMLTSLYPHNHGELKNDDDHPYDRETYLDILGAGGYRQYYFGKWHAGAGTALDHGCEGFNYPSYSNPYTKPEYRDYLARRGLATPEIFIEDDFMNWGRREREGTVVRQDGDWCNEHASGIMLAPREAHEAFFLADLAREQLRRLAEDGNGGPFHLRVDFWGPHQPYFPTADFAAMYSPADIALPVSFRENVYKNSKPACYASEHNRGVSENGKLLFPNPVAESVWQRVLARSYAQISLVDAAAGVVLEALREYGFGENTLVIMSTDHGDAVACHGGHFDKASYMPEEMIRIPMAMRYPGVVEAGAASEALVSNLDIGATVLDAAGLAYPQPVDGKSLLAACSGADTRDAVVCETHGHMEDHIGRAIISGRYKYVYNRDQLDELYDLTADPWELCNLAPRPEHGTALAAMRQKLVRWARETGDAAVPESLAG